MWWIQCDCYFVCFSCSFWFSSSTKIADSFVIQLSLRNNTTDTAVMFLIFFFVFFTSNLIFFLQTISFAFLVLMHDWPLTIKVALEPLTIKQFDCYFSFEKHFYRQSKIHVLAVYRNKTTKKEPPHQKIFM